MVINEIVATVSIVLQIKAGVVIGSASGFFYQHADDVYLVTNQHVCRDDDAGVVPDALRLRLHTDPKDLAKSADFEIPLYQGKDQLWKVHPRHAEADIAVLKVPWQKIKGSFYIRSWSKKDFLPSAYRLDPGEDVFIMGYPLAFHDRHHNLPVFRNAMIASTYGVPFQGAPLFLTDANLHPGTSGSPVITKPKTAWVDSNGNTNLITGTVYYLVGVHSGTVSPTLTGGQTIGLGAAWYAELIDEIANQF